jgi:3-phosphoshikimate 1-carboxyvinyltransferase
MRVERTGTDVHLHPTGPIHGHLRLPGSKSLTNRYLLCAALSDGHTIVDGASLASDCERMVACLRQLGIVIGIRHSSPPQIAVAGCRGHVPAGEADLDAGDAGTVMRFLTALIALGYGHYRVDGSPRMRQRPIGPLVGALQTLGAPLGYDGEAGFPPVTAMARGLVGGRVRLERVTSSQFISALLMVAPYAMSDCLISVRGRSPSRPYIAMTIHLMHKMGVEVLESKARRFVVPAGQRYRPGEYTVEPDASVATYFWGAAAVTGGAVRVEGLSRDSLQGDVHFADLLAATGCTVNTAADFIEVCGPAEGRLRGIEVDLNSMPDTVPTLAVISLFADSPTTIRNVANLRLKETDRLAALTTELTRLGAQVEKRADGLTIFPPPDRALRPTALETYNDHRMAMSLALAGLVTDGITIRDGQCVAKSFPQFFDVLNSL